MPYLPTGGPGAAISTHRWDVYCHIYPLVGRVLPYVTIGVPSAAIFTHRWGGCCHIYPPVGWVLPYLPTGGAGAANGTGAAAAPGDVAVLRVRHRTGGGEALVDHGVSVVPHLADDRVAALKLDQIVSVCNGRTE